MSDTRADRIAATLERALAPASVRVRDDSAQHATHVGAAPGGETHYSVIVVTSAFRGQSRVDRSRMVHALLAREFGSGLHALSQVLLTPEEYVAEGDPETSA
jgi:BolA protein